MPQLQRHNSDDPHADGMGIFSAQTAVSVRAQWELGSRLQYKHQAANKKAIHPARYVPIPHQGQSIRTAKRTAKPQKIVAQTPNSSIVAI